MFLLRALELQVLTRWSYLQEELRPVPQVVGENGSVKGLDAFFTEPALTAGVVLGQILKVRPAGHLDQERDKSR